MAPTFVLFLASEILTGPAVNSSTITGFLAAMYTQRNWIHVTVISITNKRNGRVSDARLMTVLSKLQDGTEKSGSSITKRKHV